MLKRELIRYITLLLSGILLSWNGCTDSITGEKNANLPPETFIFVQSSGNDTLNPGRSVQEIYWDGRDTDGFITGFYYTWRDNPADTDWIWTDERKGIFALEILGRDTSYTFQVKAVDNLGAEDASPAQQLFPIVNSPPVVEWIINTSIPDTTFTVAAFDWSATDPDGDLTIDYFEWALDDTAEWRSVSGLKRSVTINADSGLIAGDHVFYLRAVDIAGAASKILRMPSSGTWHVKSPQGQYLLIDDFEAETGASGQPDAYYQRMMTQLLTELGESGGYDYWNIEKLFPASRTQFTETLKLYKRILWYSDLVQESDPHFIAAQVAIPQFRQNGGKLIYSLQFNTGFGTQGNPLEFTPVDSLGQKYNLISSGSNYLPDPKFNDVFGILLPPLKVSVFIIGQIALRPKANAVPMYRFDDPNRESDPIFVLVGQNDNLQGQPYDFVFSGTPLHMLNGNNNLDELFRNIFRDIFRQP